MTIAISMRAARASLAGFGLSLGLGLIGGLVLPLIAAALYPTYSYAVTPYWLENWRQLGFVYLAGEIVLILYARHRGFEIRATWSLLPRWAKTALALFLATFWLSSAFVSRYPPFSMALSVGWLFQFLFAAGLFHLFRQVPLNEVKELWRGFSLGLAALAILVAIHFTIVPAALAGLERQINWDAAIPGFISARLFGAWSGAVLALLTGVAWSSEGDARAQRPLYLALGLAFALTFWTTTRAALLGWACVFPMAWMLAGRPRSRCFYTVLPLYLLAGACLTLPLQPYGHVAFTFFDQSITTSADGISSGRLTLWKTALQIAAHYPLLGSGAGSNLWLVPLGGFYHVQPHNAVVQFLLNWGVVPTVPALVLLLGATWHAHVAARRQTALLPVVLMLDCLLVVSLLDGMLHFAQFIMLIVGCLAICLAKLERVPPSGRSAESRHRTA